jgi:hypothetical protein
VIIFSKSITPRLNYIIDFISKEITTTEFSLTSDIDYYKNSQDQKLNYSSERISPDEFWLSPHTLLFEKEIKQQKIECFQLISTKAFFQTSGDYSFDIFASSFYLLSRYEEYLPHKKDEYGRYAHENSLAFKENFLHLPLINIWLKDFKEKLKQKFPQFTIHYSQFTFFPTYDIDEAFAYKHKSWQRRTGAAVRDLLSGNRKEFSLRRKVISEKKTDPYDSYQWMDALHDQYKLQPKYFFLAAEKTGKYDKNILPKEDAWKLIIKQHAEKYQIGVHPSWQSGDDPSLIEKEKSTIENAGGVKVSSSRQHYIRFTLPETFRFLIQAGIKEDFSMGYGSINGFRASVASSFHWYDLEKDEKTDLKLNPFCYMEANSCFEQKFSPEQALEEMLQYFNTVKNVNGMLVTIWHNTFLGTHKRFAGWREVYEEFLRKVFS